MNDTANPKGEILPVPAPRKPGFLARLFGTVATGNDLSIAIAPFVDAAGQDHARTLASVFQGLKGIHVKTFRETPLLTPDMERTEHLPAACSQAMGWVSKMNVDLVLWGDIPPPGTTFFIHFAAAPPLDEDPAGIISPFQALNLPVALEKDDIDGLLIASALAAMHVTQDGKIKNRRTLVAGALERAALNMDRIPSDFTLREQSSVHAAYANALATFGHLFPGGEVYHRAMLAYTQALKGTSRTDSPMNWAYQQRNLGTVLQALGERTDALDTLEQAVTAYRAALEVFSRETTPFPWATTQNRLGETLYRLDIKSGDTQGLKEALTLFQATLKILNRSWTPLLWSNTMNNLGQAAQVLGRELGNKDVIERAITACQQALKARTRDKHPTLWAATQNNMGSALFLLGRMTGQEKHYQMALDAFMGAREIYETLGLARMTKVTDKNIQHAKSHLPGKSGKSGKNDPAMWWLDDEDAP